MGMPIEDDTPLKLPMARRVKLGRPPKTPDRSLDEDRRDIAAGAYEDFFESLRDAIREAK
jgi:hypothetical protein